jgi:hypothetical protein
MWLMLMLSNSLDLHFLRRWWNRVFLLFFTYLCGSTSLHPVILYYRDFTIFWVLREKTKKNRWIFPPFPRTENEWRNRWNQMKSNEIESNESINQSKNRLLRLKSKDKFGGIYFPWKMESIISSVIINLLITQVVSKSNQIQWSS